MIPQILTQYAASYGCDAYGAGAYNENGACTTTTGSQPSIVDTALSYTGEPMFLGVLAAVLLITVAVTSIIYGTRRKKK